MDKKTTKRGIPKGSRNKPKPRMTTAQRAVMSLAREFIVEPLEAQGYNILPRNSSLEEAQRTFRLMSRATEFSTRTRRLAKLFAQALKV